MSHRIAVMTGGRIVEVGSPRDIYLHPRSRFAAQFVGLANILPARLVSSEGLGTSRLEVPFAALSCRQSAPGGRSPGSPVTVLMRPENIRISPQSFSADVNEWRGRLVSATFLGEFIDCVVACGDVLVRARVSPFTSIDIGSDVFLHIPPEQFSIIID